MLHVPLFHVETWRRYHRIFALTKETWVGMNFKIHTKASKAEEAMPSSPTEVMFDIR